MHVHFTVFSSLFLRPFFVDGKHLSNNSIDMKNQTTKKTSFEQFKNHIINKPETVKGGDDSPAIVIDDLTVG